MDHDPFPSVLFIFLVEMYLHSGTFVSVLLTGSFYCRTTYTTWWRYLIVFQPVKTYRKQIFNISKSQLQNLYVPVCSRFLRFRKLYGAPSNGRTADCQITFYHPARSNRPPQMHWCHQSLISRIVHCLTIITPAKLSALHSLSPYVSTCSPA